MPSVILQAALQMQPRLKHWQRRRGNEVPTAARNAVVSVLQNLFASYHFEPREVRIEVARPLQTGHGESFRFPRLEASIYGRWSPMSLCCNTAVLTFFDVVCGVCAICLKSTCRSTKVQKFRGTFWAAARRNKRRALCIEVRRGACPGADATQRSTAHGDLGSLEALLNVRRQASESGWCGLT